MTPWQILGVLVYCAGAVVSSGNMEQIPGAPRNPMETLASCNISFHCRMTESGVICHLTKSFKGQLSQYSLNSPGEILFRLMKDAEDATDTKKMEMKTSSCQMAGHRKRFSPENPLIFVYPTKGTEKNVFFYEKHNPKNMHKINLDFHRKVKYLYPDIGRCTFFWVQSTPEEDIYSSMRFDGKHRKRIFEGIVRYVFYDHLRQLHFIWTYREKLHILMVLNNTHHIGDIFKTGSTLDRRCCSGDAASQTLVMCTTQPMAMYYTLHALNYKNMYEIVPRELCNVTDPRVAFFPPNKLVVLDEEKNTAYLYDIPSHNRSDIVSCPISSPYSRFVGSWNSQVYINCIGGPSDSHGYFYFATQDGVETMCIKTKWWHARLVGGLA